MINRGWVWESVEYFPEGGYERKRNYFDIKRTSIFVWLTMLLLVYGAQLLKRYSLGYFGFLEILIGFIGGIISIKTLSLTDTSAWLILIASSITMMNGYENLEKFIKKQEEEY